MDQSRYEEDNTKNCIIESSIPQCLKDEPCWLGVDEAGRGPVLGPMVYGICFSPVSMKEKFGEMGFAGNENFPKELECFMWFAHGEKMGYSKTLSEEQREEIFKKINQADDMLGWMIEILSPTYISNSMLSRTKYNLNALSHDCAIRLIRTALERGVKVTEVYVDTVGDPAKYQAKLSELFPEIDITVAKKADATYPIVSAASICAKVARDKAVKNWTFSESIDSEENKYGSGYPGDPGTKKFLADNFDKVFGFTQFVRFGWSTAALIIEKDGYPVEWEDDDEDDDTANTPSVMSFFNKKDQEAKFARHRFFKDRCLSSVSTL